jgi:hypothetical protein
VCVRTTLRGRRVEQNLQDTSPGGAKYISPGRKSWVKWGNRTESRRDGTSSHAPTSALPKRASTSTASAAAVHPEHRPSPCHPEQSRGACAARSTTSLRSVAQGRLRTEPRAGIPSAVEGPLSERKRRRSEGPAFSPAPEHQSQEPPSAHPNHGFYSRSLF